MSVLLTVYFLVEIICRLRLMQNPAMGIFNRSKTTVQDYEFFEDNSAIAEGEAISGDNSAILNVSVLESTDPEVIRTARDIAVDSNRAVENTVNRAFDSLEGQRVSNEIISANALNFGESAIDEIRNAFAESFTFVDNFASQSFDFIGGQTSQFQDSVIRAVEAGSETGREAANLGAQAFERASENIKPESQVTSEKVIGSFTTIGIAVAVVAGLFLISRGN